MKFSYALEALSVRGKTLDSQSSYLQLVWLKLSLNAMETYSPCNHEIGVCNMASSAEEIVRNFNRAKLFKYCCTQTLTHECKERSLFDLEKVIYTISQILDNLLVNLLENGNKIV